MLHILEDQNLTLEDILGQKFENIILYFTATWCGPCKLISPVVQELSDDPEYKENTLFVKIDVDEFEDILESCDIKCMPTFLFYKNGEKKDTLEGCDKDQLRMKLSLL